MRWTIAQVADALGTRPGTGLNALARVAGVSIDSRAIRAGELFIAIHGPRHDGHDHVASALENGAIAAVVAEAQLSRYADPVGTRCIAVADTFEALKQLARAVRESWGGKIVGVTGSVGKTTTKEILAALLGRNASGGGAGNGHVAPRRTCAAGVDCPAGRWSCDACFAGAPGIFFVGG